MPASISYTKTNHRDTVLALLQEHPKGMTVRQISQASDIPMETADRALRVLQNFGVAARTQVKRCTIEPGKHGIVNVWRAV